MKSNHIFVWFFDSFKYTRLFLVLRTECHSIQENAQRKMGFAPFWQIIAKQENARDRPVIPSQLKQFPRLFTKTR